MITAVDRLFEAHLTVANLDASIAFYRDRVGLELAHVVPARQAAFFWVGSRGTTMLGLWAAVPIIPGWIAQCRGGTAGRRVPNPRPPAYARPWRR